MKLQVQTFLGNLTSVQVADSASIMDVKLQLQELFHRPPEDQSLLRLGKVLANEQLLAEAELHNNDVVVIAFGTLKTIVRPSSCDEYLQQIDSEAKVEESEQPVMDESVLQSLVDQGYPYDSCTQALREANGDYEAAIAILSKAGPSSRGAGAYRPEVKAMLERKEFREAKLRFQSDPSKWNEIFESLVRTFPENSTFLFNEKAELKKLMSQTDFFEAAAQQGEEEDEEYQTLDEKEKADVDSIVGKGYSKSRAVKEYIASGRKLDAALDKLKDSS